MIDYFKGAYNINLLPRVHGSALYKGSVVGLLSVLIYLAIQLKWRRRQDPFPPGVDAYMEAHTQQYMSDPYAVGVLVSSVSFLITFRANFGYQRYWEACGAVQLFMSKWMDATIHTTVFHLQSKHYDGARPPSFFDHDELNVLNLTRARRRGGEASGQSLRSVYDCEKEFLTDELGRTIIVDEESERKSPVFTSLRRLSELSERSNSRLDSERSDPNDDAQGRNSTLDTLGASFRSLMPPQTPVMPLPNGILCGRWDVIPPTREASTATRQRARLNADCFPAAQRPNDNFACRPRGQTPPLFLQELAHLSSLACAVALSTLRNDIEGMECPLDVFVPGAPWPAADPDRLPKKNRRQFQHRFHILTIFRYWLGSDRLPVNRNKHNAARPLSVLGGISNAEIQFLQKARGPHAKVSLALGWLSEFILREHLDGSLGEVHSAMISRLLQFLSDGMMGYNVARSIMYIPFPFPEAQLSSFFAVMMVVAVPFLMDQYTNTLWVGSAFSFLSVTCYVGLHEVARELENPFKNVPNDIPVCILQAMYNEALATMFSGFNPDSFWDPEMYQSSLEAAALGNLFRQNETGESTPKTPAGVKLTHPKKTKAPPNNERHVAFATADETGEVAKKLRELLAAQASEIEALTLLLDTKVGRDRTCETTRKTGNGRPALTPMGLSGNLSGEDSHNACEEDSNEAGIQDGDGTPNSAGTNHEAAINDKVGAGDNNEDSLPRLPRVAIADNSTTKPMKGGSTSVMIEGAPINSTGVDYEGKVDDITNDEVSAAYAHSHRTEASSRADLDDHALMEAEGAKDLSLEMSERGTDPRWNTLSAMISNNPAGNNKEVCNNRANNGNKNGEIEESDNENGGKETSDDSDDDNNEAGNEDAAFQAAKASGDSDARKEDITAAKNDAGNDDMTSDKAEAGDDNEANNDKEGDHSVILSDRQDIMAGSVARGSTVE